MVGGGDSGEEIFRLDAVKSRSKGVRFSTRYSRAVKSGIK
jgi:hypothetical protein